MDSCLCLLCDDCVCLIVYGRMPRPRVCYTLDTALTTDYNYVRTLICAHLPQDPGRDIYHYMSGFHHTRPAAVPAQQAFVMTC
eukprot:9441698-Pyramimonas_sp.AAC.2